MSEQPTDPQPKSPLDAALDAFVYAPIGLIFEGSTVLPQLVEKGRNQVAMAKMLGQFAVQQASQEAGKAAGKLTDQAAGILDFVGGSVTPIAEPPPPPSAPPAARPARTPKTSSPARDAARKVAAGSGKAKPRPTPVPAAAPDLEVVGDGPVATLAIPDYDGLSASQVVNRLAGLEPAELEAVRSYELANRGRKTILSKIAQLQPG